MSLRNCLIALGLAAGLTFASDAQAGKGVKKKLPAHHVHHGIVTQVDVKSGVGVITIKGHHHKKKTAAVNAAKGTKPHQGHKFTVDNKTQFVIALGKNRQTASFAAVHKGERVTITASNHVAEKVVIHEHRKPKVKPAKKK